VVEVSSLDLEEIANALADQTDYEHRWLINPQTGEVVFWTATSFAAVHWTPAQTTLVATEVAAFWALASAAAAHLWPQTKKQPVAVADTVTAFASARLSLGIGFAWWQLTQPQNASLISLLTAIIAVVSALITRSTVKAGTTPAR
jgi:hypothetical protein